MSARAASPPATPTIRDLLRQRHRGPQWYLAFEVRDAPGLARRSQGYADAIAFNTWPSQGFDVHGYEIKVERGDWLRELAHPDKTDRLARHCDFWWIVAPAGIVLESELPPTWGLLIATAKRLRRAHDAERLPRAHRDLIARDFAASLVRRRTDEEPGFRAAVEAETGRLRTALKAEHAAQGHERSRWDRELERFRDEFEAHTGLQANPYLQSGAAAAATLRAAIALLSRLDGSRIDTLMRTARHLADDVERHGAALAAALAGPDPAPDPANPPTPPAPRPTAEPDDRLRDASDP